MITAEELRIVVEAAVKNSAGMNYGQIISLVLLTTVSAFLGAYMSAKAKSIATKQDIGKITQKIEQVKSDVTKQDIEEITRKIEGVKKELEQRDRVASRKYELKYNACLNMLGILDAVLSHKMNKDDNGNPIEPDRQYATIEEFRKCHNDILITIDDPEIPPLFLDIVVGNSKNFMKDLDKIRGLVRKELEFGEGYQTNEKYTWIAINPAKKPESSA
jgi:hypothetical protein